MSSTHVATWAERYLDSGVSLAMDMTDSAGSDYDSDDSRSSVETVHRSYSYVPSDVEVRAQIMFKKEMFGDFSKCCSNCKHLKTVLSVCFRYQK